MKNEKFSEDIIHWYKLNSRDLPWRKTRDPYLIWLSEIILQQTRVNQGLPYFNKISEAFPNVLSLAKADETIFLRYWQGLGYYSRARNLLKTARIIVENGGQFPNSFLELLKLPGIGEYTAAAIASFAFKEKVPVVDGNVFRILSRYFGIDLDISQNSTKKYFFELSKELIPSKNPDIYNQAIMEFGSLQCWVKPDCEVCPLQDSCWAYKNKAIDKLPVKNQKIKIKKRYFHYFFLVKGDKIYFQERSGKDVWEGLWEPYLIESESEEISKQDLQRMNIPQIEILPYQKIHQLSHQKIFSKAYFCQVSDDFFISEKRKNQWLTLQEVDLIPKSILVENLFNYNQVNKFLTLDK